MGHSKTKNNETYKSYKLKVRGYKGDIDIKAGISEYDRKFNNMSQWIADHLTTLTIGEAAQMLPKKLIDKGGVYVQTSMSDEWKDQPLYKAFTKKFGGSNVDHLVVGCTKKVACCEYEKDLSLGFSETIFRTFGFAQEAVSNMKARMTSAKVKIGRKRVTEDSTDEEKCIQCVYEIQKNGIETEDDWKSQIEYFQMKGSMEREIERFNILHDYYSSHRDVVIDKFDSLRADMFVNFDGSKRLGHGKNLSLSGVDYTIKKKDGRDGFILTLHVGVSSITFDLFGHRALTKCGKPLLDVENMHSSKISISIEGDEMYVTIPVKVVVDKKESSMSNVVGIDINVKHAMLSTSIIDNGNIKGYVNLYRELLSDESFLAVINNTEREVFEGLSRYVMFGLIETPYLGSRIIGLTPHEKAVEDKITSCLKCLSKRLSCAGDEKRAVYVQNVIKIRALIKSVFERQLTKSREQKEYDNLMGFTKDDERRKTEGFHTTDRGAALMSEIHDLSTKIVACRDNVVEYAYRVIAENGYDGIAMENLESSTFMKTKQNFPTCKSLLGYHAIKGKTVECAKQNENVGQFVEKGYYVFTVVDEKIDDAVYSEKADKIIKCNRLYDMVIKTIHFADMKDKFVEMSNNGRVGVTIVPPYFSSQMDSISHKVFAEDITVTKTDKKGRVRKSVKTVLVDKHKVRKTQETHINGLNADYNAACNLKYIAETVAWRNAFCFKNWKSYGLPQYGTKIKNQKTMIERLGELGAIEKKIF